MQKLESFEDGDISFIDLYEDKTALNDMVSVIQKVYGTKTFAEFRDFCRKMSLNLDLDLSENIIQKLKAAEDEARMYGWTGTEKLMNFIH